MKTVQLDWKEFNIDLESISSQINTMIPGKCIGISANSKLEIHLEDSASDEEIIAIQEMYEAIQSDSEEAASYRSEQQIQEARSAMKAAIPSKTWAQMSAVERGILIGQEPTKQQLIDAGLL